MGLESNIEGDGNFIDHLNPLYPESSDYPSEGDDHIRGIKKILQNTFPNFSSQITRSGADVQNSAIPAGAVCVFYQSAVPAGWERVQGLSNGDGWMLRVVQTATTAGGAAGTHSPILNNVVPSHTHTYSTTTGYMNQNWAHGHTGSSGEDDRAHEHLVQGNTGHDSPDHAHDIPGFATIQGNGKLQSGGSWGTPTGSNTYGASARHAHYISFWTSGRNTGHYHAVYINNTDTNHTHNFSGTTAGNAGSSNWAPKYMNVMLCARKFL
jgi:hypothetical protein